MWTRGQLKENAKGKLKAYYWSGFLVTLIYSFIGGGGSGFTTSLRYNMSSIEEEQVFEYSHAISGAMLLVILLLVLAGMILGVVFTVFLVNPLAVGVKHFFLRSGEQKTEISEILFAFKKDRYMNVVKIMFLRELYTFFWSLLFVIPGIIKSYEYSMIPYLLAEDPAMDSRQAFKLSWELTDRNKFQIFVLDLSFFGWTFLGMLACGIGVMFVLPYIEATYVELFLALKAKVYYGRRDNIIPPMDGFGI